MSRRSHPGSAHFRRSRIAFASAGVPIGVSPLPEPRRIVRVVSKFGIVAVVLVCLAGAALAVVAYVSGRDSTDGQAALVVPFVIFWTAIAASVVVLLDRFIGHLRRSFAKPSKAD